MAYSDFSLKTRLHCIKAFQKLGNQTDDRIFSLPVHGTDLIFTEFETTL